MKRFFLSLLAGIVLTSLSSVAWAAKPISMDLGYALAEETPTGQAANHFANVLKELSGGTMEVKTYPSSQLGSEREMQEGCQLGSLDLAIGSTATLVNFDKIWMLFDMPLLFADYDKAFKACDSPYGLELLDGLKKQNIKGLCYIDPGYVEFLTKTRELKTPGDVKGLNIRCMESLGYITTLKSFGANPVQSATAEVYNMLQNGTVDGTSNPVATIYSFSFYENAKYLSLLHPWYSPVVLTMSMQRWNALTDEQKGWVTQAAEAAKLHSRNVRAEMEDNWRGAMEKAGLIVTRYTPEERAVWEDYAAKNIYPQIVPKSIPQEAWDKFVNSAQ